MGLLTGHDTIAAISTGLSQAGISIVRLSGDRAIEIADSLFINKKKEHILKNSGSHKLHYGFFCMADSSHVITKDSVIDEVLVSVMKAPNSYTGEDVVEVNCHGGIYITTVIYNELLKAGAIAALPGEFTKRAFLNGRIDLSRAEAVMDIISSENETSRKISLSHLTGSVYNTIKDIRSSIIEQVAYIESALDDPEHYELEGFSDSLSEKLNNISSRLNTLIDSYNDGKYIKNGIKTIILGKPNAGKSSLMNLLSGKDKSIVTDIPGTTRDLLEQDIRIKNLGITLIDTAGIRDTTDEVERIGVEKSLKAIDESDLILYMADSSVELDDNDKMILSSLSKYNIPVIFLLNKTDLPVITTLESFSNFVKKMELSEDNIISFSVKSEKGLNELKERINNLFFKGNISSVSDNVIITNSRHYQELINAKNSISLVMDSISNKMPEDFYTVDLMQSYESLGLIIGEEIGDDLVNEIFSKFCMGK